LGAGDEAVPPEGADARIVARIEACSTSR
jgi:hypothetical protein